MGTFPLVPCGVTPEWSERIGTPHRAGGRVSEGTASPAFVLRECGGRRGPFADLTAVAHNRLPA